MLDDLTARLRHIVLLFLGAVVTALLMWAGSNTDVIVGWLHVGPALAPVVATIIVGLVLQFTNLTKQYGWWVDPGAALTTPSVGHDTTPPVSQDDHVALEDAPVEPAASDASALDPSTVSDPSTTP